METGTVGRPKKRVGDATSKSVGLNVKGDRAWREWLERAAAHSRMGVSAFVDAATAKFALDAGFKEPPPERLPRHPTPGTPPTGSE